MPPCQAPATPTMSVHYPASDPDHALVVVPGPGTDRVAVELFCTRHAARGVDVWLIDAPAGVDSDTSTQATLSAGERIAETVGLPAFVYGSGSGAVAAASAMNASTLFAGAVLLIDAASAGQVRMPASHDSPPILYVVAGSDTVTAAQLSQAVVAATALPVELDVSPTDLGDLLGVDYVAHSDFVLDWCLRQLSNHLRAGWRFE